MTWHLKHIYIPAPYNHPGMAQRVQETVISQLYGPEGVESALAAGWLQEVRRHPQGYRRFAIQLMDRRAYSPIPVNFLLSWQGDILR